MLQLNDDTQHQLAELGVVLCYAHGSVVKGTAMRESDLDVAVLFHVAPIPKDAIAMTGKLQRLLHTLAPTRDLDIVILNEASPLFRQVVAVEGLLLYARSEDDRIRFECTAMHEYEASRRLHRIAFRELMARPAPL